MPARVLRGSKNNFSRGPANSNISLSVGRLPAAWTMVLGMRARSSTHRVRGEGKRALPRMATSIMCNPRPLSHRQWFHPPDLLAVVANGAVGGKLAHAGYIQDGFPRPGLR